MDGDLSQPTQPATQNVIDPRRVGEQNSGFTDEDIADIICLLIPYSINARNEAARLALANSPFVIGRDEAQNVNVDYTREDHAGNFGLSTAGPSSGPAFVLRLSAQVKDPLQGFTFGRNANRCDICFNNDSLKRLSNIHFRIFINEHGVLMLQDQSTNGTAVDEVLLKARRPGMSNKRTLNSGTKVSILLQNDAHDLAFLVRVPRREGQYEIAYQRNLHAYLERLAMLADDDGNAGTQQTIGAGPGGLVNLFPAPPQTGGAAGTAGTAGTAARRRPPPRFEPPPPDNLPREWNGSQNYNRVGQIGKGAFATVHKVTSKFDGKPYAAKELDKRRFVKNGVLDQKVENEMRIMQKIQHPNIVRYIEHFDFDERLFIIIMEYVPMGDLGSLITNRGSLPEQTVKEMAIQLIDALGYLHRKNITHRDVKPDNILIDSLSPFTVKLTDFGLSKMVDNEQTFLQTFCGTLLYCAPEVYGEYTEFDENGNRTNRPRKKSRTPGQRYDHAVDIWSLGGVLFYCLTGRPPFPVKQGTTYMELLAWIMARPLNVDPLLAVNASQACIHFLSLMLKNRPENRATIEALQRHPWITGHEDVSAEDLEQSASQLSLDDGAGNDDDLIDTRLGGQSDDEILDDDDLLDDESQIHHLLDSINGVIGSQDDAYHHDAHGTTAAEATTIRGPQAQPAQPQRLFGEVNVSAIGSSGVIPEDRLNLPLPDLGQSIDRPAGYASSDEDGDEDDLASNETFLTPRVRQQQGQQWSQPQPHPRSQTRARPQGNGDSGETSSDSDTGGARGASGETKGSGHVPAALSQSNRFQQSHSVDELNNLTFDVASQSLGGAESILGNLNMKSLAASHFRHSITDFTSSKRKPAPDTSDEFDGGAIVRPSDKPTIKRLKSDVHMDSAFGTGARTNTGSSANNSVRGSSPADGDEAAAVKAYAAVKPINNPRGARHIDLPVSKSVYWIAHDSTTWHLQYPEMTQLQYNAFEDAAESRSEEFRPGPSRLWSLAMKHFPPTPASNRLDSEPPSLRSRSTSHISDTAVSSGVDMAGDGSSDQKENIMPGHHRQLQLQQQQQQQQPNISSSPASSVPALQQVATPPYEPASSPHLQPHPPQAQIVIPVLAKQSSYKACLTSTAASFVQNISVPVTESITSWGRHPDNTLVFSPKTEQKVPKYAFKILVWRADANGGTGSEPWKDLAPWDRFDSDGEAASRYHFYISTKARAGIVVNGVPLSSWDPSNPQSASRYWIRLHDGDTVMVWHNMGDFVSQAPPSVSSASNIKPLRTELVFRCTWGGSAKPRASPAAISPVDEPTSRRLDKACSRAEQYVAHRALHQRRLAEADRDLAEREARVDQERMRSVAFELRRADVLAAALAASGASGGGGGGGLNMASRVQRPAYTQSPVSAPPMLATRDVDRTQRPPEHDPHYAGAYSGEQSSSITPTPSTAPSQQLPGRLPRQ
ncbi:Protein kinase protein rad53 [Sporothrix curviconia]|uniref:Autophagy-related protein 1 n=1 Tax=Sporothrix curviconia TaxID=1260050 RepID=A0ABP0B489_9PEZI